MRAGFALSLACALLVACASPAPRPGADSATSQTWSGRLRVQVQSEPPNSMSASFELHGQAASGQLHLLSPLGTTLATLTWTPQEARLQQGQQQQQFDSLASLSEQVTGTALPMAALFDWLRGIATPAPGWQADLSQLAQGSLSARRSQPAPVVLLRIQLD